MKTKYHHPDCNGPSVFKAIYAGLPLEFCENCGTTTGPGSYAMLVSSNDGGWALFVYEGSYWKALWCWAFHKH